MPCFLPCCCSSFFFFFPRSTAFCPITDSLVMRLFGFRRRDLPRCSTPDSPSFLGLAAFRRERESMYAKAQCERRVCMQTFSVLSLQSSIIHCLRTRVVYLYGHSAAMNRQLEQRPAMDTQSNFQQKLLLDAHILEWLQTWFASKRRDCDTSRKFFKLVCVCPCLSTYEAYRTRVQDVCTRLRLCSSSLCPVCS